MTQTKQGAPQQLAVVVGATGAFGQAIVSRLAAAGLGVVAVARSADSLDALKAQVPGLVACAADISSDASIEAIAAAVDRRCGWSCMGRASPWQAVSSPRPPGPWWMP